MTIGKQIDVAHVDLPPHLKRPVDVLRQIESILYNNNCKVWALGMFRSDFGRLESFLGAITGVEPKLIIPMFHGVQIVRMKEDRNEMPGL